MHIEYINKTFTLENIINEINLINIEDKVEYLNRNDGILVKGYIEVECEYLSLGVIKCFSDKVNVSILIPYDNILHNEIFFKLDDFDYYINNNNLSLSFKINIEGYKEVEKTFQDDNQEIEILGDYNIDLEKVKEYINDNEDIIELEQEEINNTLIENINNDEINKEEINEDIPLEKEDLKEGKRLEFNILGNEDDNKEILNNSLFNSLFKKEKKTKVYKYRVILENESYEDIAKEFNVNLFKLKNLNNNSKLITGQMIKIPNTNE